MTEFLGTHGGQIGYEVTGLTATAEETVAARPELLWTWSQTPPGSASGVRNASGGLAGAGRPQPGLGSPGTTGSRLASSMTDCVVT